MCFSSWSLMQGHSSFMERRNDTIQVAFHGCSAAGERSAHNNDLDTPAGGRQRQHNPYKENVFPVVRGPKQPRI